MLNRTENVEVELKGGRIKVSIDAKRKYLERRLKDLEICFQSLVELNCGPSQRMGHLLRGSAQTFGFHELSILGEALESVAIEGNREKINILLEKLKEALENYRQLDS